MVFADKARKRKTVRNISAGPLSLATPICNLWAASLFVYLLRCTSSCQMGVMVFPTLPWDSVTSVLSCHSPRQITYAVDTESLSNPKKQVRMNNVSPLGCFCVCS
jgi:hypothetical protein